MGHLVKLAVAALLATCLTFVSAAARADDAGPDGELCNGLDDDDDGQTDEGDICPTGEICYYMQCLVDCSEDPESCFDPSYCFNGLCHEPCGAELCPEHWICELVNSEFLCIPSVCSGFDDIDLPCIDNPYCCDEGFTPPCYCEAVPNCARTRVTP